VHDMSANFKYCRYHVYADDLQVYCHCGLSDIDDIVASMYEDIKRLAEWSVSHGLKINEKKTQSILIGYSRLLNKVDVHSVSKIMVNGVHLEYSDYVRNLGLIINKTLTWADQVNSTCNKVFSALRQLRRNNHLLPRSVRLMLIQSLIFPYFAYASLVYCDLTGELALKLQRAQNACIRFVFDLRLSDHVTPFYKITKLLRLGSRRDLQLVNQVHSILSSGSPEYFRRSFIFMSGVHGRTMRSSGCTLSIPIHRTSLYGKSFTVSGCSVWNSLPASVRGVTGRDRFRREVYDHLLRGEHV
jgi:hypothetical protein